LSANCFRRNRFSAARDLWELTLQDGNGHGAEGVEGEGSRYEALVFQFPGDVDTAFLQLTLIGLDNIGSDHEGGLFLLTGGGWSKEFDFSGMPNGVSGFAVTHLRQFASEDRCNSLILLAGAASGAEL
jgi:hypothetical protein